MSAIEILVTLVVIGFVLWLVSNIPMPGWVMKLVYGVAALFVVLWLLNVLGIYHFSGVKLR